MDRRLVGLTLDWLIEQTGEGCWYEPTTSGPHAGETFTATTYPPDPSSVLGERPVQHVEVLVGSTRAGYLVCWRTEGSARGGAELATLERAALWLGSALSVAHSIGAEPSSRRLQSPQDAMEAWWSAVLTTLSHELRTPLSIIGAGVEMFEDGDLGPVTPAQVKVLSSIAAATSRLASLADSAVLVSSAACVDESAPAFCSRPDGAVRLVVETAADQHPQTISFEPGLEGRPVAVAEKLIVRIVRELVSNAAKFVPSHGSIWVQSYVRGEFAVIEVLDNGPGIPVEEQTRIGKPFFRTSASWENETQGPGLGLAWVERTLRRYGGTLDVHTLPEEGCRVEVRVPLVQHAR